MDITYKHQEDSLTSSSQYAENTDHSQAPYQTTYRTLADRSTSAPHLFLERKKVNDWNSPTIEGVLESPATCSSEQKYCEKAATSTDVRFNQELEERDKNRVEGCMADKLFKIVNLDTGEAIDIRDENKDNFTLQYSKITNQNYVDLKDYL